MRQLLNVSIILTAINSTLSVTILAYNYTNPRLVFLFTLHIQLNNKTAPIEYQTKQIMKKTTLIIFALAFTGFLKAQDMASFHFTYNHLALSVKDVNRSADFYKQVLKLPEITNRTKMEGIRWFSLSEGQELHLISVVPGEITITKAVHLGLTSFNFDAFIKQLVLLKIPYSDWPGKPNTINIRADGIKQIFFQDPDGYWIEVNNVMQK